MVLVDTPAMVRAPCTLPRMVAMVASGVKVIPLAAANAARLTVQAPVVPPGLRGLEATQVVQALGLAACSVPGTYVNNPLVASWVSIRRLKERLCGLVELSMSAKKNSLSFKIGPPTLPPN